jgi:hypothetical protein
MDLIITNRAGQQMGVLLDPTFDCDCNGSRDFSLSIPVTEWDGSITYGCRLFVPGEEYGGIVGQISTDTELGLVTVSGWTWRGMLAQKIISPPEGEDYRTLVANGSAAAELQTLINGQFSGVILSENSDTGIGLPAAYQYKRYCTLLDGLTDMLKTAGAKLAMRYDEVSNCMIVSAEKVVDYSPEIELSQDYQLQFTYSDVRNKPNHLIVGGKGELAARTILHLYADKAGNISRIQTQFGIDEIVAFWENTSSDQLEKDARKHFEEIRNSADLSMEAQSLPDVVRIGDIVGGRDYITGQFKKLPVSNIIVKMDGGLTTKTYTLEENKK